MFSFWLRIQKYSFVYKAYKRAFFETPKSTCLNKLITKYGLLIGLKYITIQKITIDWQSFFFEKVLTRRYCYRKQNNNISNIVTCWLFFHINYESLMELCFVISTASTNY